MKKYICLVLSVLLVAILPVEALATKSVAAFQGRVYDAKNSNIYYEAQDLENGDAIFTAYENGVVVARTTLYRVDNRIETISYANGNQEITTTYVPHSTKSGIMPYSFSYLGRIRYEYSDYMGAGICGANVYYEIVNNPKDDYNVNGVYQGLTSLAAAIAGFFGWAGVTANAVASSILSALGLAGGIGSLLIPDYIVTGQSKVIEYQLKDMNYPAHANTIYGKKITVKHGGQTKYYYEGDYVEFNPWGDWSFANTVYNRLFTYSNWSLYAWN